MNDEKATLYTFTQPVRGGHHYIVIKATSDEEAAHTLIGIVSEIEQITGRVLVLGQWSEDALQLDSKMQASLVLHGHARRFVRVKATPHYKIMW